MQSTRIFVRKQTSRRGLQLLPRAAQAARRRFLLLIQPHVVLDRRRRSRFFYHSGTLFLTKYYT
ncbi:hypothetical protein D8L93_07320 [Sodalis-like symbiont of Bactericera trigonica]|nr:hypothetical protein D8L93_07320 [Sodalis-like symbiont of Bactericera trigonica]